MRWTLLLTDGTALLDLVNAVAQLALVLAIVGLVLGAAAWLLGSTTNKEINR